MKHLVVVAGPSDGGFQAFQWAVTFPDFMDGIVAVTTGPKRRADMEPLSAALTRFPADKNWNNGWYYDRGGIPATMAVVRYDTLLRYGANELLASAFPTWRSGRPACAGCPRSGRRSSIPTRC